MNILVVEDNEDSRVLLESLLQANGYEVESAENGKVALALATRRPPDLMISDILMPEMDGYVLCREVKADEQLRGIPFIFYTASYTDPGDQKLAMDLGASRFIVKPIILCTGFSELIDKDKATALGIQEYLMKPAGRKDLARAVRKVLDKKIDRTRN